MSKAIAVDNLELMELLLDYPPGKEFFTEHKNIHFYAPTDSISALKYAIEYNATSCFKALSNDSGLLAEAIKDKRLLHSCENLEICQKVFSCGYKIANAGTLLKLLQEAVEIGNFDYFKQVYEQTDTTIVKELCEKSNSNFLELLERTCEKGNVKIVEYLISKNVKHDKYKLLLIVINEGHKNLIRYLVKNDAQWIRFGYSEGYLPDYANSYNLWQYVTGLIEEGIKKN